MHGGRFSAFTADQFNAYVRAADAGGLRIVPTQAQIDAGARLVTNGHNAFTQAELDVATALCNFNLFFDDATFAAATAVHAYAPAPWYSSQHLDAYTRMNALGIVPTQAQIYAGAQLVMNGHNAFTQGELDVATALYNFNPCFDDAAHAQATAVYAYAPWFTPQHLDAYTHMTTAGGGHLGVAAGAVNPAMLNAGARLVANGHMAFTQHDLDVAEVLYPLNCAFDDAAHAQATAIHAIVPAFTERHLDAYTHMTTVGGGHLGIFAGAVDAAMLNAGARLVTNGHNAFTQAQLDTAVGE